MKTKFDYVLECYRGIEKMLRAFMEKDDPDDFMSTLLEAEKMGFNFINILKKIDRRDKTPFSKETQAFLAWGNTRQLVKSLESHLMQENISKENVAELIMLAGICGSLSARIIPIIPIKDFEENLNKFHNSGKNEREDDLGKVLLEICREHLTRTGKFPQYSQVISELKKLAKEKHYIIQEVDDEGKIHWCTKQGIEKPIPVNIKALQDRLTKIRKKIRLKPT